MIIKKIKYFSDIDKLTHSDEIYELFDEVAICPDLGNDKIMVTGCLYRLRNTDLIVAEGIYYRFNADEGIYEPDFDVALLYNSPGMPNLDKPLYWEQGTPAMMFHNYALMQSDNNVVSNLYETYVA